MRACEAVGRMSSTDPIEAAAKAHRDAIEAHANVRNSRRYRDATSHLQRVVDDFVRVVSSSALAFTRYPDSRHWLLQNATDELIEAVVATVVLTREGIF